VWAAAPYNVKKGTWCRECYRLGKYLTLDEMKSIAESRGGKCLSDKYFDSVTKLKWQCKEGHVWDAQPSAIKAGSWCPKCAINYRAEKKD
jgi:hypothetical protein